MTAGAACTSAGVPRAITLPRFKAMTWSLTRATSAMSCLIAERELRLMKPTATLVNVGRGATLDEQALASALKRNVIHSAGIDVFESEPISDTANPLLELANAFLTPHMASATHAARASMVSVAADDLQAMMEHRPPQHLLAELRHE